MWSPVELFKAVTGKGAYRIGYLVDGGTREIRLEARSPEEAEMKVQNVFGSICGVTFVERT